MCIFCLIHFNYRSDILVANKQWCTQHMVSHFWGGSKIYKVDNILSQYYNITSLSIHF